MGSAEAIKIARAKALEASIDVSAVGQGLAFDPANSQLHYRLSQLEGASVEGSNAAAGEAQARLAIALNSNRFEYWLNLASQCESNRDYPCATMAVHRALALCPMMPRVWWVAANYYLRANQPQAALPCFHRLLELGPDYLVPTLDLTLRAYGDPTTILEKVVGVGADVRPVLGFADFVSAQNDFDAAHEAWTQVTRQGSTFPFAAVQPYLERLLTRGRYPEAQAVWRYLEQQRIIATPADSSDGNLVFNGGFEQAPLEAGFDWRSMPSSYVYLDFSDSSAYHGARCLRLDFPVGQNDEFEPVYQIMPVVSGRSYTLAAYVRTSDITSDSGPRLRVVDAECPTCLDVSTASTVGTTPWHPIMVKFSTGAQTRAARLSVWRPRSRTFPMEMSGTLWIDDVSVRSSSP
jgi:tetratricopeptide (TPR) repeat protein